MANAIIIEPLDPASVTGQTTANGFSAANVLNDYMGLRWRSTGGAASQYITLDFGIDTPLDTVAVFGLSGIQPGWRMRVLLATAAQGSGFGVGAHWAGAWDDIATGRILPVSGDGKALWLAPDDAPAAARYVRIAFDTLGSAPLEIARIAIGERFAPHHNFKYGAALGIRPLGSLEFSARGVLLRRRGKKLRGLGISYEDATRSEVEAAVLPIMERVGNDSPIAIIVDPAADPQLMNRMYFGFLTGNLGAVWARPGGFQCDFNLIAMD